MTDMAEVLMVVAVLSADCILVESTRNTVQDLVVEDQARAVVPIVIRACKIARFLQPS